MSSFMFDLNSIQFDDDDSEGSGDEHSEIPARPRTSWDGTNYSRAQFYIQQQGPYRAIPPGAFPPPQPRHIQARQFNAKGTQRPAGTPSHSSCHGHCPSEDFYRGITENSELLTLINPSNAIGGEMRAIEQHKQNLSNNSSLFNSDNTTPLMANFSRITPFEDDDTISSSSNNNINSGSSVERSGSGSPMFGGRSSVCNNDDNECYQMRASRSSLDSSIQRRNFIQHYNAYMKGNPSYFSLTKGSGILDGDSKADGYLRFHRNVQQYGNPSNSQQQQQQQQQYYQQASQLHNQQAYKSGNIGNSLMNNSGYRWGNAYSVPSRSLDSSGVNSPYYDSYYSSGYASSLSGSSSSVMSEQNEVLDDPRELQKMREDITRNSAIDRHDVNEITMMLDNTHLGQKQQRNHHQRKLSLSSQMSSASSFTSSSQLSPISTSSSSSSSVIQKDRPSSPVSSTSPTAMGASTQANSSSPSPSSSGPMGSAPLQRKQQLVIVKKKLVIQKPKSKTIQQSPLSQSNTNSITQNSDDNSDSAQNVNNEPLNNDLQSLSQQQQQPQKKKRKHRGGRRGTRVMREAKERKLASLREAKLLEESQQSSTNNNDDDDNDSDNDAVEK